MFNLYKIQLKEKCEELYEENIKLKEELSKYNCDCNIIKEELQKEINKENNIKLTIVDEIK